MCNRYFVYFIAITLYPINVFAENYGAYRNYFKCGKNSDFINYFIYFIFQYVKYIINHPFVVLVTILCSIYFTQNSAFN